MLKGLKKTGTIILMLAACFLLLSTIKESFGKPIPKIKPLPGQTASPVYEDKKDSQNDKAFEEMQKLDLVLSDPLVFFVQPTIEDEGYIYSKH